MKTKYAAFVEATFAGVAEKTVCSESFPTLSEATKYVNRVKCDMEQESGCENIEWIICITEQ